ncbi:Hypothetical predicted protein [Octopus vulgaris]|uniref:Uncharacterized protein n=1 Tax=Octopus vulgaris TaxID=6645 RepID=A0AA36FCU0_OCTVU|nr:Hypothetical predicted protein [Octopus vulgaris]
MHEHQLLQWDTTAMAVALKHYNTNSDTGTPLKQHYWTLTALDKQCHHNSPKGHTDPTRPLCYHDVMMEHGEKNLQEIDITGEKQ